MAHTYFPRGMLCSDPGYEETPEVLRQKAARIPVSAQYDPWRNMLGRVQARFPEGHFPGVEVHNDCLFLQVATVGTPWDRCFTGKLWLPVGAMGERRHWLEFLISFVVPYYAVGSSRIVLRDSPNGPPAPEMQRSFALSPAELPFAKGIAAEIETTFPGYEQIPPEIGWTVVPDVQAGCKWFGEATIFTCLFSDSW